MSDPDEDRPQGRHEIQALTTRVAYQNRWLRLREDTVRRANGSEGLYGVIERPDFVVIAAIQSGAVMMVEQYRYPVRRRVWELPMGCCEPGATPAETAATELREETGLVAARMEFVSTILLAPGFCDQVGHLFLATELHQGPTAREPSEQGMTCRLVPVTDLDGMIGGGVLQDTTSLAALGVLRWRGLL